MMFRSHPFALAFNAIGFARGGVTAKPIEPQPAPAPVDPEANTFYIVLFDPITDKPTLTAHKIFDEPAKGIVAPQAEVPVTPAPVWLTPARHNEETISGFSEPALA
jgi:hypothetical protein